MFAGTAIKTITDYLKNSPGIEALFLAGSHGAGTEDQFSDLDFVMVASGFSLDNFTTISRAAIQQLGEIVLWRVSDSEVVRISSITDNWTRTDVVLLSRTQIAKRARSSLSKQELKVLFDRNEIWPMISARPGPRKIDKTKLEWQFQEFLRILGLMTVSLGRGDHLNGVTGVTYLRSLLIDLMIQESSLGRRGNMNLSRILTPPQVESLASLALPAPDREAIIAANLEFACQYITRARKFAAQTHVVWPQALEDATWKLLHKDLSIVPPAALQAQTR